MRYLSACVIVKDEPDLPDWAAFQLAVGVEHLLIYDNDSDPPVGEVLSGLVARGLATVFQYGGPTPQLAVYQDAIWKCREIQWATRWLACIDADEYIVPTAQDDIKDLLKRYDEYAGLAINWLSFGTSRHQKRQPWPIVQSYTRCQNRVDQHVKSIVQPARTLSPGRNPHFFKYPERFACVDEDGRSVTSAYNPKGRGSLVRLNHYYMKSREDWMLKMARGHPDGARACTDREFAAYELPLNEAEDRTAQRFVPKMQGFFS